MLTQIRKKILQKDVKKYYGYNGIGSEYWWNLDTISYIRKHSHLGTQRYSKKKISKPFEKSKLSMLVPYYQVGDTTYNLIPCPSGSFIKGSNDEDDANPLEEMKIEKSFFLGETEITQELYQSVMGGENPSNFKNQPKNPVERVSWYDALIFCNKLSDMHDLNRYYTITKDGKIIDTIEKKQENYKVETNEESKGFRLPTEWEWEYAAKAGTQLLYSGSNDPKEVAWYKVVGSKTHEVKGKNPNAWGFYDMSGNVWEWSADRFSSTSTKHNNRVVRGGSWYTALPYLHLANRFVEDISNRRSYNGFRVCRYI